MNAVANQVADIINRLDEKEQGFALDYPQKPSEKQEAERHEKNQAYLAKIRRGIKQCAEGRGIIRDIVEVNRKKDMAGVAQRAAARKADPNLRRLPNDNDLRVESEHARLMAYPQYQAMMSGGRTKSED